MGCDVTGAEASNGVELCNLDFLPQEGLLMLSTSTAIGTSHYAQASAGVTLPS